MLETVTTRIVRRVSNGSGFRFPNALKNWLAKSSLTPHHDTKRGSVFIIGAGPGDPELLTVKAHRLLGEADVILFDWLVGEDILNLASRACEKVFVGKRCGRHSASQAEIGRLLVGYASEGKRVVRLKGGDPSIFARTAEECEVLQANDIPFAIVPGITAASGAAAYTGMPLTNRQCARSVTMATARSKDGKLCDDLINTLRSDGSVVLYMGLNKLDAIVKDMLANGFSAELPIAVLDQVTTSHQNTCYGRLSSILPKVAEAEFAGPAVIVVGDIVEHRYAVDVTLLNSFEKEITHVL